MAPNSLALLEFSRRSTVWPTASSRSSAAPLSRICCGAKATAPSTAPLTAPSTIAKTAAPLSAAVIGPFFGGYTAVPWTIFGGARQRCWAVGSGADGNDEDAYRRSDRTFRPSGRQAGLYQEDVTPEELALLRPRSYESAGLPKTSLCRIRAAYPRDHSSAFRISRLSTPDATMAL